MFVEGHTEHRALAEFLKRWLDPQLSRPVGVATVRFDGWAQLVRDSPVKAKLYLQAPKQDVIAVIALIDLYGPTLYSADKTDAAERYVWAKQHLESNVGHPKFLQFFAVHETEAWLLSQPSIFPVEVRGSLAAKAKQPETVNFDEPPATLLDRLYMSKFKRHYRKTEDGRDLFGKLDPQVASEKCPSLKALLDEMLRLAREAGL